MDLKTGKRKSLLTVPAEPHPCAFVTGTNNLISCCICFKYSQDQRNHLVSSVLYLHRLPRWVCISNFQAVNMGTRKKSNPRTRRALPSRRGKACVQVCRKEGDVSSPLPSSCLGSETIVAITVTPRTASYCLCQTFGDLRVFVERLERYLRARPPRSPVG